MELRSQAAILLIVAASLASCARSLDSLESFPCGQLDLDCPAGWRCLQGTCVKQAPAGADAGGADPRDCEKKEDCGTSKVCVAYGNGGATCLAACTGFAGGCGQGLDCKLIIDGQLQDVVPACTGSGSSTDSCLNVNQCVDGRTCVADADNQGHCLEICSIYHQTCTDSRLKCAAGNNTPADWGYCQ